MELALPKHSITFLASADFGAEAETSVAVNPSQQWMSLAPFLHLQHSIALRYL
jgi:hypothetical protein